MQSKTSPNPVSSLNSVLAKLGLAALECDISLAGLSLDSRRLASGDLFLALPGSNSDGRDHIQSALAAGAAAVLVDESRGAVAADSPIPVVAVNELRERCAELASWFYRHPSRQLSLTGVTGTNGKTSVCWSVAQLHTVLGESCSLMGTLGSGSINALSAGTNTTASSVETNRFLSEQLARGVSSVVMEVSSHGLIQGRVDRLDFDIGVFTNISRDHLDYHGTLDAYAQAKSLLFRDGFVSRAIINRDSLYSKMMVDACGHETELLTFSSKSAAADLFLSDIHFTAAGATAKVSTPWGKGRIETPQFGLFNLENLLAALAVLCCKGYPLQSVLDSIPRLQPAPGRLQCCGGNGLPLVLVDYAHTPDALASVLDALRLHGAGRLVCVFGCGGNRDRGKRPMMLEVAVDGADTVVVTSDNPRDEEPGAIIADVLAGSAGSEARVVDIVDRAEAIEWAVAQAGADDVVLVAGKGHEMYQEVRGVRTRFSDLDVVGKALREWQVRV